MDAASARRAYQTLDGLRGVGAALVVMRHVPFLFGPIRVPESFLAVDLFYLVSGFVVAHAYGQRLAGGGFLRTFAITRLIRLYPLYLFGLAIGVVVALAAILNEPAGFWTWRKLAVAIFTGVLMIPRFPGLSVNGSTMNGPIWTLLYELIANFFYAVGIRFMNTAVLVAIIIVCGTGLVVAEFHYGTLDVGYSLTDQWAALARVGFSFFTGVLVSRLVGARRWDFEPAAWLCVILVGVILAVTVPDPVIPYYELGVILIGFPVLLVAASCVEPSAVTGRVFAKIGLISYGVYLLHQPLGVLARRVLIGGHVSVPRDAGGLVFGAVFLMLVGGLAWWLDGHYDAPVRNWMRSRLLPSSPPRTAAASAP